MIFLFWIFWGTFIGVFGAWNLRVIVGKKGLLTKRGFWEGGTFWGVFGRNFFFQGSWESLRWQNPKNFGNQDFFFARGGGKF